MLGEPGSASSALSRAGHSGLVSCAEESIPLVCVLILPLTLAQVFPFHISRNPSLPEALVIVPSAEKLACLKVSSSSTPRHTEVREFLALASFSSIRPQIPVME